MQYGNSFSASNIWISLNQQASKGYCYQCHFSRYLIFLQGVVVRPECNVFYKLSCTEQRREGVAAYLWSEDCSLLFFDITSDHRLINKTDIKAIVSFS